jgi:hypothetical protein
MNIYFIIYCSFFLLSIIKNFEINLSNFYKKKKIIIITILFLSLFIGLRDDIGGDSIRYNEYYELVKSGVEKFIDGSESKQKPLFYLINKYASFFDFGYILVNFFSALVFSISLISFCIFSGNLFLGLTIAMPILIVIIGMGYITQSIAIAFLMLAYLQFIKQRKVLFLILTATGALFHPSVIIFAPIIFMNFFDKNYFRKFITLVITIIIILTIFRFYFWEMFSNYVLDDLSSTGAIYRMLLNFISVVIFLIFINKKKLDNNYKFLFYFFCISSLILIIFVGASFATTAFDRIGLYLYPIQILIINRFLNINYSVDSRKVVSFIFFIIYFFFMYIWFNYSDFSSDWVPYKNILF